MKFHLITQLILTVFLASTAFGHPGPAGHTHPEDWPFEALVVGLVIVCGIVCFRKFSKKPRS